MAALVASAAAAVKRWIGALIDAKHPPVKAARALLACALAACAPAPGPGAPSAAMPGDVPLFRDRLWDDGRAEISSYRVRRSRYGEMRDAEAILIVVNESL